MPKLCWLTDIHLDFVDGNALVSLVDQVDLANPDAVLISGDIAVAKTLKRYLDELETKLQLPIFFVLGNHDYYEGSISEVRQSVAALCAQSKYLHFLTQSGVHQLSDKACILGHDGWADGRFGDFANSDVMLNDYLLIKEFIKSGFYSRTENAKSKRLAMLQSLAEESAVHVERNAREAAARFERVLILTHVPPFKEACLYRGRISNDMFLPHLANKILGERLIAVARDNPQTSFLVLCGHTHGKAELAVLENLMVWTGGAEYGLPHVQRAWEID